MPKKLEDKGTGIKLMDGSHTSAVTFKSMYYAEADHYMIEVYDDKYKAIGLAVTAAQGRFLPDDHGAFVRLRYLGTNNEHYQWYIENEGQPGGLPTGAMHHFCKSDCKACKAKVRDGETIHARRWAPITRKEAHEVLVSWGYPGLEAPVSAPQKFEDEIDWGTEEEEADSPGTSAKKRPDLPRRRAKKPEAEEKEDEERSPKRPLQLKEREGVLSPELERRRNALDEMLHDEPDEKAKRGLDDKLDSLREKLRGRAGGVANGSKRPGGILAQRASELTVKKKKKKHKSTGKVLAELSKAISKKRSHSDSRDSSGSSSDGLGDGGGRESSGWEERRKKYRRIAEQSPGKLMMQALENMQEQLGASFGEIRKDEEKLSPVVTCYLLTVIMPAVGVKNISQHQLRELRTIALAVDMLLKGQSDSCGDVLLQRFKSLCMQAGKGGALNLGTRWGEKGTGQPFSSAPPRPTDQKRGHQVASEKNEDKCPDKSTLQRRERRSAGEGDSPGGKPESQVCAGAHSRSKGGSEKEGRGNQVGLEEPCVRPCEGEERGGEMTARDKEAGGVLASPAASPSDGSGQWIFEGTSCTDEGSALFSQLWELLNLQCSTWAIFRERCYVMYGDFTCLNVIQLGIGIMQLLLSMPREAMKDVPKKTTPNRRQRDVLPLPLPSVGAALKLLRLLKTSPNGFVVFDDGSLKGIPKQQRKLLVARACSQIWRFNCTMVLNGQYLHWKGPIFQSFGDHTPAQVEARNNIEKCCNYFCKDPSKNLGPGKFSELVKMKGVDYTGEEISHALPLRLGELLPGLPDRAVAGSLDAAKVADEHVRAWLEHPEQCLLPREQWPEVLPRASMNVKAEGWPAIAATLFARNILAPIDYEDIYKVNNSPVLNGMFAVLKKGQPGKGEKQVTRLIMNLTPSNSLQRLMTADLDTLTSAALWAGAQLPAGCCLLWSGDDQKGAFYAWSLPRSWRGLMTFKWPAPGWCAGKPHVKEVWLASKVIPMGWLNSVSLFQHLHRRLQPHPMGAGLEGEQEMRRDRPVPVSATEADGGWISYYLDDFDCPEIIPRSMAMQMVGTMSEKHQNQRQAYERAGVAISADKAHLREVRVERMGAEVDGVDGWLGAPIQKKLECGFFVLWALQTRLCRQKVLLMILGRLVRSFEFRRPLMSLLNEAWPKTKAMISRPLKPNTIKELIRATAALPLAVSNLFTPVSGLVTVSDASEAGGGLCGSAGLSEEGQRVLESIRSLGSQREAVSFAPAGSVDAQCKKEGPRILVISLFDGIGAMMVSLQRLKCRVVGYASCEIDKRCKRLTRTRWPGIIELGDITKVDRKAIQALSEAVKYKLDLVIIGAGSPCQDLSSLNATGAGLAGEKSKLFYEVPRVVALVKEEFQVPVESFVENVASMTPKSVAEFSEVLKVRATLLDAKHFCHCRRPRFYWATWKIQPQGEEALDTCEAWDHWIFPDMRGDASKWLVPGCTWNTKTGLLPTFTRPQRRERPPFKPAGLEHASSKAVERWEADKYFVQVYNYEDEHMITQEDGSLRLPLVCEKEVFMGFDRGYVSKFWG
eukprot:s223_g36.t1